MGNNSTNINKANNHLSLSTNRTTTGDIGKVLALDKHKNVAVLNQLMGSHSMTIVFFDLQCVQSFNTILELFADKKVKRCMLDEACNNAIDSFNQKKSMFNLNENLCI